MIDRDPARVRQKMVNFVSLPSSRLTRDWRAIDVDAFVADLQSTATWLSRCPMTSRWRLRARCERCLMSTRCWRWEQINGDHVLDDTTTSAVKLSEAHGNWNGNIGDCALLRHWQPGDNSSTSNADCSSQSSRRSGPQQLTLVAAIHANSGGQ